MLVHESRFIFYSKSIILFDTFWSESIYQAALLLYNLYYLFNQPMFDFDISAPFIIFVAVLLGLLYWLTRQPKFDPGPEPVRIVGDFTFEELAEFDGVKKPQTFLAIKHIIYDVTGSSFYTKDGAYGAFAAHDASINLAKMDHSEKLLNTWPNFTLNQEEKSTLDDWAARFEVKYRKVGVIKEKSDQ